MALKFDSNNVAEGVEHGIQWATKTAPMYGAVNGYAKLPAGHPWADLDLQMGEGEVRVHGGITYGPDKDGWVGFDTLHFLDLWPGSPASDRYEDGDRGREWTPELVAEEARHLARLIAGAAKA